MFSATPTSEWNHCGVPRAREQSQFGYQSSPRSFGSHVTVQSSVHPPVRLHHRATMWNLTLFRWCESLQPDILHPCCGQLTAVKTVCTDQYQMTFSRAEVWTHRGYVFLWSYPLTSYEYSIPSARALPLALVKSIYYKSSVTRPKRKQCWLNGERMLIHLSILSSPSLAI